MKRLLLIFLLLITLIFNSYSTDIGACQSIGSSDTYRLTGDYTDTADCFPITTSNVYIDLNGYTITGDSVGTSDAILPSNNIVNITIANGVFENFGRGLRYEQTGVGVLDITFENVSFVNSSIQDIYLNAGSTSYSKNVTFINCSFEKDVYAINLHKFSFEGTGSSNRLSITGMDTLEFDSPTGSYTFNELDLSNVVNINSNNDELIVNDFCLSTFTGTTDMSGVPINFGSNQTDTGDCFSIAVDNLYIDMNGYSLIGDGGAGSDAFIPGIDTTNFTITNGIIDNWGRGFNYQQSGSGVLDVTIDDIVFQNISIEDVFFSGGSTTYSKNVTFIDTTFETDTQFTNMHKVSITGTTVDSIFSVSALNTLELNSPTNYFTFNEIDLANVANINTNGDEIIVNDFCISSFTGTTDMSGIPINFGSNQTDTADCFSIAVDNLYIDMNGYSLIGDGGAGSDAFTPGIDTTNFTITNGIIDNWGRGFNYQQSGLGILDITIDNIIFQNISIEDVFFSGGSTTYSKNVTFIDTTFETDTQFTNMHKVSITGTTIDSIFSVSALNTLELNSPTNYFTFNEIDLANVANINTNGDEIIVNDFCISSFTGTTNMMGVPINFGSNQTDTGSCFSIAVDNIYIDMNGYSLIGDGVVNSNAFIPGIDTTNFTITNGILDNWGRGFYYQQAGLGILDITIDNIVFQNTNADDVYFSGGSNTYSKNVTITNCIMNDSLYFNRMNTITLYGNNITSANDITDTDLATFNIVQNLDGNDVGNFWRDFGAGCTDPGNNYQVEYAGYTYTICNSDDYSVSGITDTAPVIAIVAPSGGSGSSSSGSSSPGAIFPLGTLLISIISLIFFFILN